MGFFGNSVEGGRPSWKVTPGGDIRRSLLGRGGKEVKIHRALIGVSGVLYADLI